MKYVGCVLIGVGLLLSSSMLLIPFKIGDPKDIVSYATLGICVVMLGAMIFGHSLMSEGEGDDE